MPSCFFVKHSKSCFFFFNCIQYLFVVHVPFNSSSNNSNMLIHSNIPSQYANDKVNPYIPYNFIGLHIPCFTVLFTLKCSVIAKCSAAVYILHASDIQVRFLLVIIKSPVNIM
jgi:hypothetical protein